MKKVLMSAVLMLAAISFANAQDVKTEKKKCDKTEKCEKCKKHKDVDGKTGATTKAEKCDKTCKDSCKGKECKKNAACKKCDKKSGKGCCKVALSAIRKNAPNVTSKPTRSSQSFHTNNECARRDSHLCGRFIIDCKCLFCLFMSTLTSDRQILVYYGLDD